MLLVFISVREFLTSLSGDYDELVIWGNPSDTKIDATLGDWWYTIARLLILSP